MAGFVAPNPLNDSTVVVAAAELNGEANGIKISNGLNGHPKSPLDPGFAMRVQEKYNQERDKRFRPDGIGQFVEVQNEYKHLGKDVWDDSASRGLSVEDGASFPVFILGAGLAGILSAVRLRQQGIPADDMCIVDTATGFGGTWYWNRYPGIMCDVESYMYLPLLEEMDYMPKHKYSYGSEIREYCESIAEKFDIHRRAVWRTQVKELRWDGQAQQWVIQLNQEGSSLTVSSSFVMTGSGLLSTPHLPRLEGIEEFKGHSFHTSRWDYNYTGGAPGDPRMTGLKDKRVAIIGTGATAVQCVPRLAEWSKELHVFQRTPSAVDRRDQRETDPEMWKQEIASKKGWQRARQENFHKFVCNASTESDVDLVNDEWSKMKSYSTLIGGPHKFERPIEDETEEMKKLDLVRQERVRRRVNEIVDDNETGENLKAWYESWCKRPCFHDEYLPAFNKSNVTLVDTDGKGAERITEKGVVFGGKEYEFDVIIFATGFTSPLSSMSARAGLKVIGGDGRNLDENWADEGCHTLHGLMIRGFPNLFKIDPIQAGPSANIVFTIDVLARHAAYILSKCRKQRAEKGKAENAAGLVIEPGKDAEDEWVQRIVETAGLWAPIATCTPGYLNGEGFKVEGEENLAKMAQMGIYAWGANKYAGVLESWQADGQMKGLEVTF